MKFRPVLVLSPFAFVLSLAPMTSPAQAPAAPSVRCTLTLSGAPSDADTAFNTGSYAQAEQLYAAQSAPAAVAGVVRSQLQQGKLDQALATANKAVAAAPNSADAHALLGEALERNGQIPEASAEFTHALSLDRCSARGHFGAGQLFELAAMPATAHHEFTVAHQLAPKDPEIAVAWQAGLPAAQRAPAIHAILALTGTGPGVVRAEQRRRLESDAALIEQGKFCHLAAPANNATLELKPLMDNGIRVRDWGLTARIDDRASLLLELDTSVPGVVLTRDAATKAGVVPAVKGDDAATNNGFVGVADSIKIGSLELKDCPVRVVENSALVNRNSLIGPQIFGDYAMNINFATRALKLTPLPARPGDTAASAPGDPAKDRYIAPEMQAWSHAYIADGRILMPTAINKSKPYLFMLDTGGQFTTVSPTVAEKDLKLSSDATANLRGVSSDIVKVYQVTRGGSSALGDREELGGGLDPGDNSVVADIRDGSGNLIKLGRPFKAPTFEFARVSRLDDSAYSFDISPLSRAAGVEVSGIVGFSILQDIFVNLDYRDGLIKLDFDNSYLYRTRDHTY